MKTFFCVAVGAAVGLGTGNVRAETGDEAARAIAASRGAKRVDLLALRLGAGVGSGKGTVLRAGGVAEVWPLRHVGLGADGAIAGQSTGNWADGGTYREARTIAPFLGLRMAAPLTGSFILHLGAGYASVRRTVKPPFCVFTLHGECPEPVTTRYHGISAVSSFGWAGHLGDNPLEAGAFGRFEGIVDPSGEVPTNYLGTLNLEVGFGI